MLIPSRMSSLMRDVAEAATKGHHSIDPIFNMLHRGASQVPTSAPYVRNPELQTRLSISVTENAVPQAPRKRCREEEAEERDGLPSPKTRALTGTDKQISATTDPYWSVETDMYCSSDTMDWLLQIDTPELIRLIDESESSGSV